MEGWQRDRKKAFQKMKTQTSSVKQNQKMGNSIIITLFLLMIMLAILSIFGCEFLIKFLTESKFFVLKDVAIYGNSNIKSADIFDYAGLNIEADRMYSFMSHIIEKRIRSCSNCIRDVKIRRDILKGRLVINIEEREPKAIISDTLDSSFKVVDFDGYIIDELTSKSLASSLYKNIPLIFDDKINIDEQEESYIISRSTNLGLNTLAEMEIKIPELLPRITEIDARNSEDIIIYMQNGAYLRLASDRISDGLSDAKCLFLKSKAIFFDKRINYIDLRFIGAVYCG